MLTVKEIDSAKPKAKPYKLADGEGLYVEVMPTGAKYWRLKYRIAGKEKRLALGVYPDVRPPEARDAAKKARDLIRAGTDPGEERKAAKNAARLAGDNTFEAVTLEWLDGQEVSCRDSPAPQNIGSHEEGCFPLDRQASH